MGYLQRIVLIFVIFSFSCFKALATEDPKIDSLIHQLSLTKDENIKVDILLDLALITNWTDVSKCEEYARQALFLSQKNNYIRGLAYSNYYLANVFSSYELDFSEKLILNSLNYAVQLGDSSVIGSVYQVFAKLKYNVKLYEDAMEYSAKALKIYLLIEKPTQVAGCYGNLALISSKTSGDSSAFEYFQKAIDIYLREGDYLGLAINYVNLGEYLLGLGDFKQSKFYFDKSLEIVDAHDFVRVYPYVNKGLSSYYLSSEEFELSSKYAKEALLFSKANSNSLEELDALKLLEEISVKTSDVESAYKYSKQINALSDSINKTSRLRQLDLLETRFKFEEQIKQQEFEKLKVEAETYRRESIYGLVILVVLILVFIFIGLYLFQRSKSRRKTLEQKNTLLEKEKLTKDLEFKNKELTTGVMYLLKKNEFISNISNKLKRIGLDDGVLDFDYIKKIVLELDKSISDNNWKEFEIRFKEVHVGFYNNLSNNYPDLTPNEMRLCAFLRLNMTSKEISELTFQSPESIKKARYRLRKKLNLMRDDTLVTFLSKM